ncbi:type I-E CRISPR-associated protein Cse1/CasA [Epidermidibacterium keratini]|uniref:Type I-E CRISPR-associated protein Cse1/CasA n=1 Tax=Epidermidibacterium keratini TaxID=1891644 RepID=A0A7L4YMA3_9ACTN|nr:type I-E CRISPR-associated protein Cse1/CasA [Epidermidibacterium keratini]QHC00192.1 type I-E CRISPR-associated protein Cse1/CasA [Epidermidibacterium keratini]
MTSTFNLIDEPWIQVRKLDGAFETVSIRTALDSAHSIRGINGDSPTQDVALFRLLLAILWRSLTALEKTPNQTTPSATTRVPDDPLGEWEEVWGEAKLPPDAISAYLDRVHDRFDLIDPDKPFSQVADLRTQKGEFTGLDRLIPELPAGEQFFTMRTRASIASLPLPEAARWVVHAQAFDPSGIKSGAVGDNRVKGGKGYPIGQAWAGWLGLIVLEGDSLFETLMLNLPLDTTTSSDSAVWEREPLSASEEDRDSAPWGPVDLLTWPSRRIRLRVEHGVATGALIANGDRLHPRNRHEVEIMTSWRNSPAQAKAQGMDKALMPQEHSLDVSAWRGLSRTLATSPDRTGSYGEKSLTLRWIGRLQDDRIIPRDKRIHTRTVGVIYGSQSSVIDDVVHDSLDLQAAILGTPELQTLAVDGVRDAENVARIIGRFAEDLARAAGRGSDTPFAAGRLAAYARFDALYPRWVREIGPDTVVETHRAAWQVQVRRAANELIRELEASAGPDAIVGREIPDSKGIPRPLNAAIAEMIAYGALRKSLIHAYPATPKETAR